MNAIHTFLVDPAEEARAAMAAALGEDQPWIAHDSLPQVAQSIDAGSVPAVILVGPGVVHDDTIMLAESIQDERLSVRLIQFAKVLDPDRLRDAMRVGVADVIEVGAFPDEVAQAIARATRELTAQVALGAPVVAVQQPTPVIAVAAGKGGVGTSLITTNLAMALANRGLKVGLLDLDVRSGDLAIMLQARPSLTVLDAIDRIDHLDEDAIEGYMTKVSDQIELLAAPLDGGEVHLPTSPFMRVLGMVSDRVDVVVADVGQPIDSTARAVLSEASEVVLITSMEVTSVRGTRRVLAELGAIGVAGSTVRVIANQSDVSTGLSAADVQKALNKDIDAAIPFDKGAARSINQGDPLINRRRSKAGQALDSLAASMIDSLGLTDDE